MKGKIRENISNSGKPFSAMVNSAATQPATATDQKPITFRELDVRISWQYCIIPIHNESDV